MDHWCLQLVIYTVMKATISDNLSRVRQAIDTACRGVGKDPERVRLMAVSKNHPAASVQDAIAAGQTLFGENRVQEAMEKFSGLNESYELHMIGHLQSNKIKDAVSMCGCIQSVDTTKTLRKVSAQAQSSLRPMDILFEVNTSEEDSKYGVGTAEELDALVREAQFLPSIRVRGLMTIAPFTSDKKRIRASFVRLRRMFEDIGMLDVFHDWDTLSMGMSSDFTIAIEEGSTLVRIGTAIFGERL